MTKEQEEAIEYLKKHIKYFEEQIKFIEATDCDYYDEELELYQNRVKQFNIVLSMLEEKEYKLKQLGKGQKVLIQSRKKWKRRYYKMKDKNKNLQNKIIDLMAEYISNIIDCPFESEKTYLDCERMCDVRTDKECWKQYFENKAK